MKKGEFYIRQPLPAASSGYRKMMNKFKNRTAPEYFPVMTRITDTTGKIRGLISHTSDGIKEFLTFLPLFDNWYMQVEPKPDYTICQKTKNVLANHKIICERLKKLDEKRSILIK